MLIAIEGCLGAGKTTVARGLAALRRSKLLLEDFEANPFLAAFYQDPVGNAVETEFWFLIQHYHQLKGVASAVSGSEVVSDFHLGKDLIYADLNLDSRTRGIFEDLYELCSEKAPSPDLLVFLSISNDLLVERIRRRSREFELAIDPTYYATVNAAYEQFVVGYTGLKLQVRMDEWDFVGNSSLYEKLASLIDEELSLK